MQIDVRVCEPNEIALLRQCYREEMNCQIIHDSIHARPGWTVEYALHLGAAAGYGSVAVAGPWTKSHALYEFYVKRDYRRHIFDLFAALRTTCSATIVETQTNDPILPVMLHTFAQNVHRNLASQRTFQKAGFVPIGNILVGDLAKHAQS